VRQRIALSLLLLAALALVAVALYQRYFPRGDGTSSSNVLIHEFLLYPEKRSPLINMALERCPGAPFVLPSAGLIGLMYGDTARPYSTARRHTGIDIFGDGASGTVPVHAVYDGYLTRLPEWRSSVILRHDDPLQPGRTLWTYYTHMASRDGAASYIAPQFPAGTSGVFVLQGTLLGYQGEYAGSGVPVAMHLHLSVVLSDAAGQFLNEAVLANTVDPSPYFGLPLSLEDEPQPRPIRCG
jgi:hypothetical protein